MTRYVGLIRGINVGSNRKLPMAMLRDAIVAAGGRDVATYIQSGNAVFDHDGAAGTVETALERAVLEASGLDVPVMVRTASEWTAMMAANPYAVDDPTKVHVAFFRDPIDVEAASRIDQARFEPEAFTVVGREMFLSLPNGMGVAKLPPALSILRVGTARNWRTVEKLAEMV